MSKEWLVSLKAGDRVAIGSHMGGFRVAVVDRTTATQVIVGDQRFSKKNGGLIGYSGFRTPRIAELTDQICEEIELRALRNWFNTCNWNSRPIEELRAMKAAHDAAAPKEAK